MQSQRRRKATSVRRVLRAARSNLGGTDRIKADFRNLGEHLWQFSLPIELFLPHGSPSVCRHRAPCKPSNPTQHETTQLKARFSSWALRLPLPQMRTGGEKTPPAPHCVARRHAAPPPRLGRPRAPRSHHLWHPRNSTPGPQSSNPNTRRRGRRCAPSLPPRQLSPLSPY